MEVNPVREPRVSAMIVDLLSPGERRAGLMVLGMMSVLAALEAVGVASVMPFLAVLGDPALVETHPVLSWAYDQGGFRSIDGFLFALGVAAFIIVLATAVFRIATTHAINSWSEMRRYSIGARLLSVYLRQPYAFFLHKNTAELSKTILSEVDEVVLKVLRPALYVVAYTLVASGIIVLLVWMDPAMAVYVALVVGGAYIVVYFGVRGVLGRMGALRLAANSERFTTAAEALQGIKDLKVLGREEAYLRRFRTPAAAFSRYQAASMTLSTVPKYLIEAVGLGGVLLLSLFLIGSEGDLGTILPVLGVYAFAGYRLLPAAQHVFKGLSDLRYGLPALESTWREINEAPGPDRSLRPTGGVRLRDSVVFEGVSFRYPGAPREAVHKLRFEIRARSSVAFVGTTGAGKTTAVDLLLGLLRPTEGRVLVDGVELTADRVRSWQDGIGYVPQSIFLADATVAENIAFGIEPGSIDIPAVERAARLACIHDFIVERLPEGYYTRIGERGVRLSGGQRQRLGIARALYHDPHVLVLDEATSALDGLTERSIMKAVEGLAGKKTIVIIAHRPSTVEGCDRRFQLADGRLVTIESRAGPPESGRATVP
jgi:ATP-binding cassette, subfamily B, bacterial PglK